MKTRHLLLGLIVLVLMLGGGALFIMVRLGSLAVEATLYRTIPEAEAAIKKDPNNVLAHERLGEMLMSKDTSRAIEEYRTVLRLQPDNRQAMYFLGVLLRKTGKTDEAKILFQPLTGRDDEWGQRAEKELQKMAPHQ